MPAFHFRVAFQGGGPDTAFQEVDGMAVKREVETVVEGGENRFAHRLPKIAEAPNLILKRAITDRNSPLVSWCREVLEGDLAQPIRPQSLDVHLLDAAGEPLCTWSIVNAFPVQWVVESFGALKNEVAIERIELAYAYVNRVK
ncbi:MAG: phage tail protein [Geminicoccaceae bacterium]|nr:MAG: phage tail protein [Geminicoccaceae bacterium]